ncbi:ABC transporter permease [Allopusillimonas ginsengisoli]|uniref:ABC transporter permease n=1 Tax=Allopusillimonas ginsengisoli TaxID=453575 RepID=UPI001020CF96|nr:ABC transporter permease [Allopusillimonas ginsengisoli]TEA69608.1 ABC transporter permease [Allopusillimonas ginsengisoli]
MGISRADITAIALFMRQDLLDRHRGNALGAAWLLIQPLSLIVLFSTVFSHLMKARLNSYAGPYAYTVYLIAGVLAWGLFANTVQRVAGIYSEKAGLIRKIPVNLGVMPLYVLGVELVVFCISFALYAAYLLVIGHGLNLAWLWLPLVVGLLCMVAYGVGLVLAMLDVFVPDVNNLLGIVIQYGFWMTPIVYVPDILPPWLRPVVWLNPVYWAMESIHGIVLDGRLPSYLPMTGLAVLGVGLLALAAWMHGRLEKQLRDLL